MAVMTLKTRAAVAPLFARIARAYEADREGRLLTFLEDQIHAYGILFREEEKPPAPHPVRRLTLVK